MNVGASRQSGGRLLGLAAYCTQIVFRERWRSYAGVVILLGLTGGLSLFAIAGARRTQSSYPRFLRSANASTVAVTDGAVDDRKTGAAIAALPGVRQSRSYVSFSAEVLVRGKPDFSQDPELTGTPDGRYFDQDRFAATHGRRPDPGRFDEAAVNEFAAKTFRYRLGQRVELGLYSQEQFAAPTFSRHPPPPKLRIVVTIVGIGLFPDEVLQDDGDRTTRMLLTQAFTERAQTYANYSVQGLVLAHGDADLASVKRGVLHLVPRGTAVFRVTSGDTFHALQAVQPLSIALGLFGGIAGVAGLVLVTQALTRIMRLERDTQAALRALGCRPGAIIRTATMGPILAILTGTLLAIAVAVAASPAMPIGAVRKVEVTRGVNIDFTVMGLGGLVMAVVLCAATGIAAWHESPHRLVNRRRSATRPSRVVAAASSASMSPAALAGLQFAFEPKEAATAVPVRSVMAGAAIAIVALVASVTFGASLSTLLRQPRLYGWDWNATFVDGLGYGNIPLDKAQSVLDQDSHVAGWSGVYFGSDTIDGHDVPLLGMDPGSTVIPPIVQGTAIGHANEIVLGAATAASLHRKIGDEVTLAGEGKPHRVRVVGLATFPTVGIVHGPRTSLGVGALVAPTLVPGSNLDITNTKVGRFGPNAIFIRYRRGTKEAPETARLQRSLGRYADFAGSTVLPTQRPAEIVNSGSIGNAPVGLAVALALGAMVSLGLAVGTSVRRRRADFVLLKTLGFTPRQLAATVFWQATATIMVGLLVGMPLGLAFGRKLWFLFARRLDVVPATTIPWLAVVGVAIASIAIANGIAAVPARAVRHVDASRPTRAD